MVIRNEGLKFSSARRANDDMSMIKAGSLAIFGIQKERALSFSVLSGANLEAQLGQARETVDSYFGSVLATFEASGGSPDSIGAIADLKSSLGTVRDNVDTRARLADSSFSEYTDLIGSFISVLVGCAHSAPEAYRMQFSGFLLLQSAQEYASRVQGRAGSIATLDVPITDASLLGLVSDYASISNNLNSPALPATEGVDMKRAEVFAANEWQSISDAVITITRQAYSGGYGLNGPAVELAGSTIVDLVYAVMTASDLEIREDVSANLNQARRTIIAVASIVMSLLLISFIFTLLVLTSLMRRVRQITDAFGEIATGGGDLTRRIGTPVHDEVGLLADDFNAFSSSLNGIVAGVKKSAAGLSSDMEELATNMNETASAVEQIAATIDSIRQQSMNQGASVTESVATTEEISRQVNTLVSAVERQAESIAVSSSSIEEMVANVQSVTANVERMGEYYKRLEAKSASGREAIGHAASQAREIEDQSASLQDTNAIIAGIAAQTNLLAMNAAIEAAHAGDAGAGFAVVADEIRKLAENVAHQSKEVAKTITSIRHVISAVAGASARSEKDFAEIVEQITLLSHLEEEVLYAMQEQSQGSVQILESLSSMNGIAQEVRGESTRMGEGSDAILQEMRRLLTLSSELENGMNEMAAGAGQIREAAASTNELSLRATASVRTLSLDMDKFKTE